MTSVNTDREQRDMPVNSKYETVTLHSALTLESRPLVSPDELACVVAASGESVRVGTMSPWEANTFPSR